MEGKLSRGLLLNIWAEGPGKRVGECAPGSSHSLGSHSLGIACFFLLFVCFLML